MVWKTKCSILKSLKFGTNSTHEVKRTGHALRANLDPAFIRRVVAWGCY
jgi:hypothetical protein